MMRRILLFVYSGNAWFVRRTICLILENVYFVETPIELLGTIVNNFKLGI